MKVAIADLLCFKWLFLIGSYQVWATEDILKYDHKHRTHKAVEKANGLWCHRCYTMDINKEYCMNVTKNDTSLHYKCEGDMRTCMVKRVSYSTTSSNSSIVHKVWSLERNCTQKCEPGCIIIEWNLCNGLPDKWSRAKSFVLEILVSIDEPYNGRERIKLYQCTSCCEGQNFCNGGNKGFAPEVTSIFQLAFSYVFSFFVNLRVIKFDGVYSGERTKIRVCSTCCETSFCNIGRGRSARQMVSRFIFALCFIFKIFEN